MSADRMFCPRCGESLPRGLERCDACGAPLRAFAAPPGSERSHHTPRAKGGRPHAGQPVPGVAWLLLVAGLAVGGMVGYALRSSVGPRGEDGMPKGPADILAGSGAGAGAPPSGMMGGMPGGVQGGAGSPQGAMPSQIMQMVASYKAVLDKNPDDLEANIGLGNLQFDSGQWAKAIEAYTRALKVDPKNVDVRVDRAIAYHSTGANDVAKTELTRVTRENPSHKNAWLNLGVVTSQLGERAAAVRAWERYLELDPNGQHAASIRQEIENLKRAP